MDKAYSIEYGDIIEAEDAYSLFLNETICDSRKFECPDENCHAQVTCVGMSKLPKDRKQDIHFRIYGTHSSECCFNELTEKNSSTTNLDHSNNFKSYDSITFKLKRPVDYYKKKIYTNTSGKYSLKEEAVLKYKTEYSKNNTTSTFLLSSIVKIYKKGFKGRVVIENQCINIEDLFVDVEKHDMKPYLGISRIYYFIGYLKKRKIYFISKKSFFLGDKYFDGFVFLHLGVKQRDKSQQEKIEKYLNNKKELLVEVFLYGPLLNNSTSILWNIDNSDYLYIKPLENET